jgi:hypothetical protein
MSKMALEDAALAALSRAVADAGHTVRLVERPDRDPAHPLTVDGIFEIDGTRWAVEHCRITFESTGPAAQAGVERALRPALERLAIEARRTITVGVLPPYGEPESGTYYDAVLDTARRAIEAGEDQWWDDGCTSVQLSVADQDSAVRFIMVLSDTPDIAEQLAHTLKETIGSKANGQLRAAKEAGFPVLLLLDQVTPVETKMPANFLAAPATVSTVVRAILDDHPGIVDEVWMRDRLEALHRLF